MIAGLTRQLSQTGFDGLAFWGVNLSKDLFSKIVAKINFTPFNLMSRNEELIYLFAVDYALPRQTSAGSIVVDEIKRNLPDFSPWFCEQLLNTITREDQAGRIDLITRPQWIDLCEKIKTRFK